MEFANETLIYTFDKTDRPFQLGSHRLFFSLPWGYTPAYRNHKKHPHIQTHLDPHSSYSHSRTNSPTRNH